jgi:hypothetical protein
VPGGGRFAGRGEMGSLNIGVDAWIIQDGNYGDFTVGQKAQFALEFYPHSLKSSNRKSPSSTYLKASRYQICGQVVYRTKSVWVLDAGFLAYQESPPPRYATKGSWVEGEIYLGVDPFMYFEHLKNMSGMPSLAYSFRIEQIFLETTPWLTKTDESGRPVMMVRDERKESHREVAETDAWNDDGGHAHYVLKCASMDGRV